MSPQLSAPGLLALALFAVSPALHASSVDAIYSFGDSLSDVGNDYLATGGITPGSPYSAGRFSNGNVWVQDLAALLGVAPLVPSLAGGTDFAYGGAESGATLFHTAVSPIDLTGPMGQINQFQASHLVGGVPTADPNSLYTIWIGSNDLDDVPLTATPAQINTDLSQIAANVDFAISTLASDGAKNFLILDVTDLGLTPEATSLGAGASASALAAAFDQYYLLPSLSSIPGASSLSLSVLDTYSLLDTIHASPSTFGLSDVTDPCLTGVNYAIYSGGTPCANPNSYLFWDHIHPTAAADVFVADAAAAALPVAPTPEPDSLILAATGLLGTFIARRRFAR